jgi:hypothetical protein
VSSPTLVKTPRTAEELAEAEAAERRRQRALRIDALSVDRSRFTHPLLEQASRQVAENFEDEEARIARRRARGATPTRTEILRTLTRRPSFWRRLIWNER